MCQPKFKFTMITLLLLLLTACRTSTHSANEFSLENSAISSKSTSYRAEVSQQVELTKKSPSEIRHKPQKESKGNTQSYVGLQYPPLPSDLNNLGGFLLGEEGGSSQNSYSINLVQQKNGRIIMWLDILISRDRNGTAIFRVVDVADLPNFDKKIEIVTGGSNECSVNGKPDPNLIVLAKLEDADTQYLTKIRKAWQVEQTVGKFKGLSLEGIQIKCQNVNYGI